MLALLQKDYTRQGAPEQLGYMMNLGYYNGQVVYMVQGMYCGPRDEGYAAIQPLLQIPAPAANHRRATGGGQGGHVPGAEQLF